MKRKPLETMKCEEELAQSELIYKNEAHTLYVPCGKPAKFECSFGVNTKSCIPARLCGIHANQAKRRGYNVRPIK